MIKAFLLLGLVCGSLAAKIDIFSATPSAYTFTPVCVSVPAGYKLVGGGVNTGAASIGQSYPINQTAWCANYQNVRAGNGPSIITTYALGLYDPDNNYATSIFQSTGTGTASVTVPSGYTLVGGGVNTDYGFLYENYPNTIRADSTSASTWTASAAVNPSAPPNTALPSVTVYAIGLRALKQGYSIGNVVASSSASASQSEPNGVYKVKATASPLTPAGQTTAGGFRGSSSNLPYASFPPSANKWESDANGQGATITSYNLAVSFTEPSRASCSVEVSAVARPNGSWMSDRTYNQLFDLVVSNTGTCKLTAVRLAFSPSSGSVSQKWNLDNDYNLQNFGRSIAPGSSFNGAGMVVSGPSAPTVRASVVTKGCECSA